MPSKKMLKKQQKSKNNRKRQTLPTTLQIVPLGFRKANLAWVGTPSLTEGGAGTGTFYTLRLNSIFDPDFTGTGSVAAGYAALTSLYTLFRVVRARIVLRFYMSSTGAALVGYLTGMNTTFPANLSYMAVEPNSVSRVIQGNTGGGHSVAEYNKVIDLPRVCGLTKQQYMTDFDFAHATGSNPSKNVYLTVFMVGRTSSAETVKVDVRIIYEVQLSNPYQAITA